MPLSFIARHRLLSLLILGWLLSFTILGGLRWQSGREERQLTAFDAALSKAIQQRVAEQIVPHTHGAVVPDEDVVLPGSNFDMSDFDKHARRTDPPLSASEQFDALEPTAKTKVLNRLPTDVRASLERTQSAVTYVESEKEKSEFWEATCDWAILIGLIFSIPWLWYFLLDRLTEVSRAMRG
jgi:type II secretory pathway pseudopilin PulG